MNLGDRFTLNGCGPLLTVVDIDGSWITLAWRIQSGSPVVEMTVHQSCLTPMASSWTGPSK